MTFLATPERTDAAPLAVPPDQLPHLDMDSSIDAASTGQQVHILSMERHEVLESPARGDPQSAEMTPRELMDLVGLTEEQVKARAQPSAPPGILRWILIGINALYDRLADLLWPLGGLLKWTGTRYLLGLVGILLVIGAVYWLCLGRFGWTWYTCLLE